MPKKSKDRPTESTAKQDTGGDPGWSDVDGSEEQDALVEESAEGEIDDLSKDPHLIRVVSKVRRAEKHDDFKREVVGWVLGGSIIFFMLGLVYGSASGDYELAERWWAVFGPIVGFLFRWLFDHRDEDEEKGATS